MPKKPIIPITEDMIAPTGLRLANCIIDSLVIIPFCFFFFVIFLHIFFTMLTIDVGLTQIFHNDWVGIPALIAFVVPYYFFTEMLFSKSPAKLITQTTVMMIDGTKPNGNIILRRTLCRLIPFEFLSFVSKRRGLHDTLSNTYVVKQNLVDEVWRSSFRRNG